MVYSSGVFLSKGKAMGLSTTEVLEILKITKVTLYKWIMMGKIKPIRHEIGSRVYNDFDPEEVERIKSLMIKKREKGKSLLKEI